MTAVYPESGDHIEGFDAASVTKEWHLKDTHEQNMSFSAVLPVDVHVRGLEVEVEMALPIVDGIKDFFNRSKTPGDVEGAANGSDRRKKILNSISADFPRGTLSAIIGGSGSGKTTLLNLLSHRMRGSNLTTTGSLLYNGSPNLSSFTNAYVTQTDILLPALTVRETLRYAASLRLPSSTKNQERRQLVEEIILELGLKECAETRVGDGGRQRGCSGGERRRVSIGVQMLGNPSILFLDEPTTGLDATSAFHLVKTLKHLATTGRTVVATIHQPRSDIFFLFDRITLLSKGHPVYSGLTKNCLGWFEGLHPGGLKPHVNPADYLIDMAAVDNRTREAEVESQTRVDRLLSAWRMESDRVFKHVDASNETKSEKTFTDVALLKAKVEHSAPVWRQIQVLTSRTILTTVRDPMGMVASWTEAILMGIVCGLVFLNLPESLSGIRSRQGALYLTSAIHVYLFLLYETYRLSNIDIALFDRERGEGVIGVFAWMASRRIAHGLLEDVTVPFLFSVIFYFMCGFEANPAKFFTYFSVVFLHHQIAVSFAVFSVAISRDFSIATLIANMIATFQTYSSGYFIQADTIPVYVRWIKWISYVFYGFAALSANEFTNKFYECPTGDARTDPSCIEYRGDFILQSLSFPNGWITVPMCALVGFVVFFTITGALILQFWTVDIHFSPVNKSRSDVDASAGKQVMCIDEGKKVTRVDVDLVNCTLEIYKPSIRGAGTHLEILKAVTTRFEAGELNVILGPSGSGKSSLLNLMAQRLYSSPWIRYRSSGAMLFNGSNPSDSVVRSLCSYVTQDDNALLPYLTVREMLRFAAGLRLPNWMSKQDKQNKAEDVILKLGLKDCADNMIGDELTKGISGGEKRRVSIAVQVLTEPQILILDEPTSGLDAFTASSILEVLNGLAMEGRTVVCSIHQGRSDLFNQFGNILLLAKGGEVAYSGKATKMLPYFGGLGYNCPSNTNPADFALDLVSVDLRAEKNEASSREKVKRLTASFDPKEHFESAARTISLPAELGKLKRDMAPFNVAYPLLLKRGIVQFKRQPQIAIARIMQVVGLGSFIAIFFAPLGNDYYSVQNRLGCIQQILPLYFVGMLQNVGLYPNERDVFYKEHDDRAYSVESFFLAYLTLEIPFEVLSGLLFATLGATADNLQRSIQMYFVVVLCSFCIVSCGESLGIIFNTVFSSSAGFALNVTSTVLSIGTFMSGIVSIDMPAFFNGINYISPIKYAAAALVVQSFRGMEFVCTDVQKLPDGSCPITNGDQVLDLYHFNVPLAQNLGALVATTVIYRLLAYTILRLTRLHLSVGRKEKGGEQKAVEEK